MTFGTPRVHHDRQMQVRFFQETDIAELETAINNWLAVNPRREIVNVLQSAIFPPGAGRELIVGVWYIED
jgi:hypothetical protein